MAYIGMVAALAAVDLTIKNFVEEQDGESFPKEVKGTKGRILLHKSHNPGFPFGCLKEKTELVQMGPLAITSFLGGMLACLLPRKGQVMEKLALCLILGGAASNLYDRLVRHYVVDYFSIQWGRLKKVVFNLGDMFIFLGVGLMVAMAVFHSAKRD